MKARGMYEESNPKEFCALDTDVLKALRRCSCHVLCTNREGAPDLPLACSWMVGAGGGGAGIHG